MHCYLLQPFELEPALLPCAKVKDWDANLASSTSLSAMISVPNARFLYRANLFLLPLPHLPCQPLQSRYNIIEPTTIRSTHILSSNLNPLFLDPYIHCSNDYHSLVFTLLALMHLLSSLVIHLVLEPNKARLRDSFRWRFWVMVEIEFIWQDRRSSCIESIQTWTPPFLYFFHDESTSHKWLLQTIENQCI
jgi:hypothetical protein